MHKVGAHDQEPLQIVEIRAANKIVQLDEPFNGGNDWLLDSSFRLKNVWDKDIVSVSVYLGFPETIVSGNMMSFQTRLGNEPGLPEGVAIAPLLLKPKEDVTLNLDAERYRGLVKFIESRHKMTDLNKVDVQIAFIVFADGSAWSGGNILRQDPNNPRLWIPVPKAKRL